MSETVHLRRSMYVYPWDVAEQGARNISVELAAIGIDTLSVASSYHAGHFVQPRGKKRRTYFPEDGTVYFRPNPALWQTGEIQPRVAAQLENEGNALADLVALRDDTGLSISCWTVCLHNTRLGLSHPGHVTRNAFGDPNYYSLCPSSPEARRYVRTLVRDLTTQYRPNVIEIETPGFMQFPHGYHHEKDGLGLTPEEEFLLSLCFCEHCRTGSAASGIDAGGAADIVQRAIVAACERELPVRTFPTFPERGLTSFHSEPALIDYLLWRATVVTNLVNEIRQEADERTSVLIITEPAAWREGIDLDQIAKVSDGVALLGYGYDPAGLGAMVREARSTIGADKALGIALRPFVSDISSAAELAELSAAAARAGATRLHYYNYGLVPAARLAWVGTAIRAAARG